MSDSKVVAVCEKHWPTFQFDGSGFVKAVAGELGIALSGQANDIVDQIQRLPWSSASSGTVAASKANEGAFVIAGLKQSPHGHVAVVTSGGLAFGKYPTAYWGQLGGRGHKQTTINYSWNAADRDHVIHRYVRI